MKSKIHEDQVSKIKNLSKIIFTLCLIILLSPVNQTKAQKPAPTSKCSAPSTSLVYSKHENALVYKNEDDITSPDILIETLPFSRKSSVPLIIDPDMRGSFTLKKHPALLLPEYYTVTIEDKVTGEIFDLKTNDSYTFVVDKHVEDRFILQMSLAKTNFTAMR